MVCDQIIREKERKLGRKLTEKEKREIEFGCTMFIL